MSMVPLIMADMKEFGLDVFCMMPLVQFFAMQDGWTDGQLHRHISPIEIKTNMALINHEPD